MTDPIRIRQKPGKWCLRAGGAVLGETTQALALSEGELPEVLYFPKADIAMAVLEPSATRSTCPHKGEARYWSIQTKSALIADAGWSYDAPTEAAARLAGHIAFSPGKVTIEEI